MSNHLTICYLTYRKQPHIEWFFDSLARECQGDYNNLRCVVVDHRVDEPGRREAIVAKAPPSLAVVHVAPKPTVWQGKHRLTSRDYFAASNARNTGLCLALDGWIAYADDLAVLLPGWLRSVRQAMREGYLVLGAYKKVTDLVVAAGKVVSYRDHPQGLDSRWNAGSDTCAVHVGGGALFGCSLAAPVEAFLHINGWDEDCDSMGGEDYIAGHMLEANGYALRYDRRMMTLEDDSRHHEELVFPRIIKSAPRDASVTMLEWVLQGGRHRAPGYHPGGIRALRASVLSGEPFPVCGIPEHDWRDGQPLREM